MTKARLHKLPYKADNSNNKIIARAIAEAVSQSVCHPGILDMYSGFYSLLSMPMLARFNVTQGHKYTKFRFVLVSENILFFFLHLQY